jgi:hypothetical protein
MITLLTILQFIFLLSAGLIAVGFVIVAAVKIFWVVHEALTSYSSEERAWGFMVLFIILMGIGGILTIAKQALSQ